MVDVLDPTVSVVIPTRDGRETLPATLRSLERQSYPRDLAEVIVVDDGSPEGELDGVLGAAGPVTCLRQEAAGAAAARNRGAARARGSILVFVDDDVELSPGALRALVEVLREDPRAIVVGRLSPAPPSNAFERLEVIRSVPVPEGVTAIDFTECYSGLLGVWASAFAALGRFRDPTGGWPSWDDVDFGYRAQAAGMKLLRCSRAQAMHHDRASADLGTLCRRWQAASVSSVRLFQRHPGIQHAFPMYRDKLPVAWGRDPASLVARKLLRSAVSSAPAAWCVRRAAEGLAGRGLLPALARPLSGLSIGAAMWRGLRDGIARHGPFDSRADPPVCVPSEGAVHVDDPRARRS